MDWLTPLGHLATLLVVANGTPVLLHMILGARLARPLDGGHRLRDGRPLFGPTKTLRGVIGAVAVTTLVAPLLGVPAAVGAQIGAAAMGGDLLSSFLKRRLGYAPSRTVLGLDQIPESLIPALAAAPALGLSAREIAAAVAVFIVIELVLSRLPARPAPRTGDGA